VFESKKVASHKLGIIFYSCQLEQLLLSSAAAALWEAITLEFEPEIFNALIFCLVISSRLGARQKLHPYLMGEDNVKNHMQSGTNDLFIKLELKATITYVEWENCLVSAWPNQDRQMYWKHVTFVCSNLPFLCPSRWEVVDGLQPKDFFCYVH
jgi:hypothetical protein